MVATKDINERELLTYIEERKKANFETPNPAEAWMAKGFPEKVIYAKLGRLLDQGLLEYGVSIRQCWLTLKGELRLKELRKGDSHGVPTL